MIYYVDLVMPLYKVNIQSDYRKCFKDYDIRFSNYIYNIIGARALVPLSRNKEFKMCSAICHLQELLPVFRVKNSIGMPLNYIFTLDGFYLIKLLDYVGTTQLGITNKILKCIETWSTDLFCIFHPLYLIKYLFVDL